MRVRTFFAGTLAALACLASAGGGATPALAAPAPGALGQPDFGANVYIFTHVVAVDDDSGIGGVDGPTDAIAVVGTPCPDVVEDDVVAVHDQAGPGLARLWPLRRALPEDRGDLERGRRHEMPYDPPSQAAWMEAPGVDGFAAFKVARGVNSFSGYGMGSYSFFNQGLNIYAANAFEVPASLPAGGLHDLLTIFLDKVHGKGGILNVINDTGGSSTIANPDVPVTVVSYP